MSVIAKHQKTLEVLWIGKRIGYGFIPPITSGEEWDFLGSIHATRLTTLALNGIQCYGQTLATLINQCPALENVLLWGTPEISQNVLDALSALQRLTQLDLYISNRYALNNDSTDMAAFCRTAPKTTRRLCFRGAGSIGFVTNEVLHSIAKHMGSFLRDLVLDTSLSNSVKDMAWFFQQLKQLECLELDGVMCLSQPAFESLGRLQKLMAVRLYLCQSVTNEALDVLITQSHSLRRLGVVYCNLADPERFLRDAQMVIKHAYVKG
ncbi:hypothetical protein BDB00DRAFT_798540 [Zychaea mexicana]|uniref:uncharacterized protein n=1 Tax=Zychaea mexicana TaxID=64656 RepID=UPI0022FEF577|nr:uncharacterized protein BDB00DRAFT_798540 [Zychaea mexicana]KAI9498579.1 hypothetical protein BDB00DRAFT_798540 [Zychaea mexicana]